MAAAMPCKKKARTSNTKVAAEVTASQKVPKTIYGRTVESQDSTRQRVELSLPTKHEDHMASKGFTSMTHHTVVHKFMSMPQAMKIRGAKAAVDKEWKKIDTIPVWQMEKIKSKIKRDYSRSTKRQKESPLCYIDGHVSPRKTRTKNQSHRHRGRVVLRGDIAKDDSGTCAVLTEQGSSASQMTAAKVLDVIARLPSCDGQAAGARSAHTKLIRLPGQTLKIPWYLLNDIEMDTHWQDCRGKDNSRKFYWNFDG